VERLGPLTIVAISHQPEWAQVASQVVDLSAFLPVAQTDAEA
jgi:hypothetical protein